MRLPRDLSAEDLIRGLRRVGYTISRERGSHVRLTTETGGRHHVTVPRHRALRVGTLAGVIADVAAHLGLSRDELLRRMFGDRGAPR